MIYFASEDVSNNADPQNSSASFPISTSRVRLISCDLRATLSTSFLLRLFIQCLREQTSFMTLDSRTLAPYVLLVINLFSKLVLFRNSLSSISLNHMFPLRLGLSSFFSSSSLSYSHTIGTSPDQLHLIWSMMSQVLTSLHPHTSFSYSSFREDIRWSSSLSLQFLFVLHFDLLSILTSICILQILLLLFLQFLLSPFFSSLTCVILQCKGRRSCKLFFNQIFVVSILPSYWSSTTSV